MQWRTRHTEDLTTPHATDLTDLALEAWDDVQESVSLVWKAWLQLFPNDPVWNPVGAGLTLTFFVALIIWLIKVRPG